MSIEIRPQIKYFCNKKATIRSRTVKIMIANLFPPSCKANMNLLELTATVGTEMILKVLSAEAETRVEPEGENFRQVGGKEWACRIRRIG